MQSHFVLPDLQFFCPPPHTQATTNTSWWSKGGGWVLGEDPSPSAPSCLLLDWSVRVPLSLPLRRGMVTAAEPSLHLPPYSNNCALLPLPDVACVPGSPTTRCITYFISFSFAECLLESGPLSPWDTHVKRGICLERALAPANMKEEKYNLVWINGLTTIKMDAANTQRKKGFISYQLNFHILYKLQRLRQVCI